MRPVPLPPSNFTALASERLLPDPPEWLESLSNPRGDHVLQEDRPFVAPLNPKAAAVLVPVVWHEDEPALLFTERASSLRQHSGQIAFPGGRVDDEDGSPLVTAYREAEEEIGLARSFVNLLGYLDPYLSATNYLVIPVVGLVPPIYSLTLNPDEVTDTFEVPLSFLMDPENHQLHAREWKGQLHRYYAIAYGERYIWGVTAGIIRNLYEKLYRP